LEFFVNITLGGVMVAMNRESVGQHSEANTPGKLQDLLNRKQVEVITVGSERTVAEAVKTMCLYKVGAVVVVEQSVPVGVFTERDLMHRVVGSDKNPDQVLVGEVMTTPFASGVPELDIDEAAEMMSQNRIRHLPVVKNGELLGMISSGDILASKLHSNESVMRHMEEYFFRH
jgi:CBS domain-containing protein